MKKALLVGIDKYENSSMNFDDGCSNDVKNMTEVLITYYGFRQEDITVLLNEFAKKQIIMNKLENMVVNSKEGDHLAFFHSSHGSVVRDVNGDEKDRWDEVICPHDMNWDKGIYILDDELNNVFMKSPTGVSMTAFFDTCFAGGLTKEGTINNSSKFIIPPDFNFFNNKKAKIHKMASNVVNPLFAAFSACSQNQTSTFCNIGGVQNSVFTYYLCHQIRLATGDITKIKLINKTKANIKKDRYKQTPRLECDNKKKRTNLFS